MSDTPKRVRKFGDVPKTPPKDNVAKPTNKLAKPAVKLPVVPPARPAAHLPVVTPKKPISVLLPKKEEPASRFQNLLPDIDGITRDIIESDLDHTKAVQIESKVDDMVDWAPNVIAWCADRRFLDLRPFAKQAEILLNLYEEYCVTADTLVPTEQGLVQIGALANDNEPMREFSVRVATKDGNFVTSRAGWMGKKEVFRVGVSNGMEVRATASQPFLVLTDEMEQVWKPLSEIRVGDVVAVAGEHGLYPAEDPRIEVDMSGPWHGSVQQHGVPQSMTASLARLLGYFVGDGHCGPWLRGRTAYWFTNSAKEVVDDFLAVLTECFPGVPHIVTRGAGHWDVRIWGIRFATWMHAAFPEVHVKSPEKTVPPLILRSTEATQTAFLHGYLACDSSVECPRLFSTSKQLLLQVQTMLAQRGVYTRLRLFSEEGKVRPGPKNREVHQRHDLWVLWLTSPAFMAKVGFGCRTGVSKRVDDRNGPTYLPNNVVLKLWSALIASGAPQEVFRDKSRRGVRKVPFKWLSENASALRAIDEVDAAAGERLRAILHSSVHWIEVSFIEADGVEDTYDLTVPGPESFIGNGIVLHNCPRCSDLNYLADIPVGDSVERIISKVAMLEFGLCPHCGFTKADGRASGRFVDPLELVAVIGQRAGKSALTGMAASYLVHRNAALTTPWKSYGLTPGQVIDFTIVATTVSQSEKTLWSTFSAMLKNSPWFKAYKAVCDDAGKKHGLKETVRATETFIWLDHKKMLIYFASNNPSSLRGTTRFGAAIDELGWFDSEQGSQKIRANGPETYSALNNACMTLRNAFNKEVVKDKSTTLPVPVMFNISSPRAMNDAIMTIYRDRAGDARTVRRHWATWEANPTFTQASLVRELAAPNGVRDFAAAPPLTDDPLIPRLHIVADAFKSSLAVDPNYGHIIAPTVDGQIVDLEAPSGTGTAQFISAEIEERPEVIFPTLTTELREALGPWAAVYDDIMTRPPSRRAHVMGVDLGATTNALAVVCGYLVDNKFVTDFALEVKPTRNRSVNIAHVYEHLIVPLVERLNVVAVFYDRWSSLHQIQDLAARYGTLGPLNAANDRRKWMRTLVKEKSLPAFLADQYSLSVADALTLVSRLEQGDCLFPAMEVGMMELMINKKLDPTLYPFAHLALQMSTVRARGARLLKPVGGDDDLFRAWANAAVKAFNDEMVVSLLKQEGPFHVKKRGKGLGPIGSYVALGNPGKGIRRAENLSAGASSTSGPAGFAISVRKGTIRSM